MDDVRYIDLQSRTVFWEELGMLPELKQTPEYRNAAAIWWDNEIEDWLNANAKGHSNPHGAGVWFSDPADAMLFKLTFAGTFSFKS